MPDAMSNEDFRRILTGEHPDLARIRMNLKRIPSSPRCKLCNAPFGGAGGAVMKHFGFGRFPGNPAICQNCISQYRKTGVSGAEIPVTLLFADIRGSTGIGEPSSAGRTGMPSRRMSSPVDSSALPPLIARIVSIESLDSSALARCVAKSSRTLEPAARASGMASLYSAQALAVLPSFS
jgi:hypothetical protein